MIDLANQQGEKNTIFFDRVFYTETYLKYEGYEGDPWHHFINTGLKKLSQPNLWFDSAFYLQQLQKRDPTIDFLTIELIESFYQENWRLGISAHWMFDPYYYVQQLNETLISIEENPLLHFLSGGWQSADPHPLFSQNFYRNNYPDVAESEMNPAEHFLMFGWKENRQPHALFQTKFYKDSNPDVESSNVLQHYILHGYKEFRKPCIIFDFEYYLNQIENKPLDIDPVCHYITEGDKLELSPHPLFETKYIKSIYNLDENTNALAFYLLQTNSSLETHKYFSDEYYLSQLDDANIFPLMPLEHFIVSNSSLSPSPKFDLNLYKQKNPDIGNMNPLLHYCKHGRFEGRSFPYKWSFAFLDQVDKALALEPKVLAAHKLFENLAVHTMPNYQLVAFKLISRFYIELGSFTFDFVVLLSGMRLGGAELAAYNLVTSLVRQSKKVLVIFTDNAPIERSDWWIRGENLHFVSLFQLAKDSSYEDRIAFLANFLGRTSTSTIINCNSFVGWETYARYGKPLHKLHKLTAMLFCYDYDKHFKKAGYATDYFSSCWNYISLFITDNQAFIKELSDDYGILDTERAKLTTLYQPANKSFTHFEPQVFINNIQNNSNSDAKPKVFWSSRLVRQKRPDILVKIARELPNFDFHLWTDTSDLAPHANNNPIPNNIVFHPPFHNLRSIPFEECTAFLYTSSWDGIPTILINVLALGVPVIAPNVGGIGELITNESGWIIENPEDIEAFKAAIYEATSNPQAVNKKLLNAQSVIQQSRSQQNFDQQIAILFDLTEGNPNDQ